MTLKKLFLGLSRGARGRCPQCGQGKLFAEGIRICKSCEVCRSDILLDEGDLWFFLLVLDRAILIFPMVVMLFLGWNKEHPYVFYIGIGVLVVLFLISQKARLGLCVALYQYLRHV